MMRFLHLADVHLDTTFLCRSPELRAHLRQALRTAFERAVDCALEEQVDAVLIAGDLFDNERLSFATENFLLRQVGRLHEAGVACVYVTGNHDPGGRSSRAARIGWPDSFHYIRDRKPVSVEIRRGSGDVVGCVVGAGHVTAAEQENLAASFHAAVDGVPHVGLLHTMVTSANGVAEHDRYAPCSVEDLRRPGYRYWALGHIHVRDRVCDRSHAYYAGNIQGRSPRETGPKGGLLVTLRDGAPPDVDFRPFAPMRWEAVRLDALADVRDLRALELRVRRGFEAAAAAGDGAAGGATDWLLRVVLSGPCPLAAELNDDDQRAELEEALAASLGAVDVEVRRERLTAPVDVDAHRGDPHLLGETLALLEELADDPETLAELAPDALAGDPADRDAYLVSLLRDLDREAALRLLAS